MRRDPLFYKLFQQTPTLLFDLIGVHPDHAEDYRFDAVAVKEPKFEIDGVFLPPESEPGVVYFCEVQFQKDEQLYERLFSESLLYFYRNRARFSDWQAVLIYPSRSFEQSQCYPYRALLNSDQVHRIYLDELGNIQSLPISVAATVLTIVDESEAPEAARDLLERTEQAGLSAEQRSALIDIVTSIMVYKFADLSRLEIKAMLGLNLTEEPRAIREAKEEGRQEGHQEGRQEGRQAEARSLILRLLTRRFGGLPPAVQSHIESLPLEALEYLGEALLDFNSLADLDSWLVANC